ncbi:unnamed protein product [Lathyrus sativus]|nr:unnamed protein product [Lathyrus sativus]
MGNFRASSPSCAPNVESLLCSSTANPEDSGNNQLWGMRNDDDDDDDMCVIDDKEEFSVCDVKHKSFVPDNFESFNLMSDPSEDRGCKFDATPKLENREVSLDTDESYKSRTQFLLITMFNAPVLQVFGSPNDAEKLEFLFYN